MVRRSYFTRRAAFALLIFVALPLHAADDPPARAARAIKEEILLYGDDAASLTLAPLQWRSAEWERFAEAAALVASVYAKDPPLYDTAQENRSSSSDRFAKRITPFGGGRANKLSALMIVAGAGLHDTTLRDAGRDSLESELWAAGIATPLLKRTFGRARPSQELGARSFHPLGYRYQSFPSGHATNAFAFATAVAAHYDGWVVPSVVYTVATGVALSRVNDRAHFPSDVVAGALIGHTAARGIVTRHGLARPRRSFTVLPIIAPRTAGVLFKIE